MAKMQKSRDAADVLIIGAGASGAVAAPVLGTNLGRYTSAHEVRIGGPNKMIDEAFVGVRSLPAHQRLPTAFPLHNSCLAQSSDRSNERAKYR